MSHYSKQRRYLSRGQVAKRFGVTTRTVKRWEKRPELDFPIVTMINGRGYHDEEKIEGFERRVVKATAKALQPAKENTSSEAAQVAA